jgi:cytochrome c oxidase assembly protein subunit 15
MDRLGLVRYFNPKGEVMESELGRERAVVIWLLAVCLTIFAMVVVGGVTRLTHSGLSMVEWQPIMGTIPPLSDVEWQATFDIYKQYPEYKTINRGMSLTEFKSIFYWEYGHRVLGRLIGLIFLVPFIIFYMQKRFDSGMKVKLTFAFVLGGMQGLMGWYMVKSGLVDEPRVSHYRLAAHLALAMFLLAYLFWVVLEIISRHMPSVQRAAKSEVLTRLAWLLMAVLIVQIIYGAFTAGLKAGFGYNTFPLMNEQWIADAVGMMTPLWLNLFESSATVQFIHRWLGVVTTVLALGVWIYGINKQLPTRQRWGLHILLGVALIQLLLGIGTLIYTVPISLASLHQAGACLLLLANVYVLFSLGTPGNLSSNDPGEL